MRWFLFVYLITVRLLLGIKGEDAVPSASSPPASAVNESSASAIPATTNSPASEAPATPAATDSSASQTSTKSDTLTDPKNTSIPNSSDKSTENATDSSSLTPKTEQSTTTSEPAPAKEPEVPAEPLAKPEYPLSLPDFQQFSYQNFVVNFDSVVRDLTRIQESRLSGTDRFMEYITSLRRSAIEQIDRIKRNISDDILYNRSLTLDKKADYYDRLNKSYQEAISHIDTVIEAQTSAVTTLLAGLNIDNDVSELMKAVQKIVDGQLKTANNLLQIPQLIQDNINSGYAGLEKTVKEIRFDLDAWKYK